MSNLASPVLTPDSVSSLKVVDLRQELDRRGLDKSGLKAELVKRLEKSLLDESVNTDGDESLNENEEDKENIEDQSDEKNNKNERKVSENKDNLSTETNDSTEIFSTEEREETKEVTGEAESNKSEAPAEEKPTAMEEFEVKNDNGEPAQKEDITDKDNESPETSAPHDVQEDASETASAIIDLTDEVNMANEDTEEDAPMESTEPVKETSVPMEEDNAPKTEESASQEESVNGEQDEKENEQNNNKDADKEETTADKSIDVDSTNATQQSESTEQSNENKTDSPNKANEKPSGSSVSSTPIDAKPVEKKTDLSRCIWISNLSSLTKAIDLKDLCVKFGKVLGAKVVTSAKTPGAQCFGFVTLSMSDEAEKCIESLHKTTLHDKVIQVEKAKTDPTPAKKPTESTKEAEKKSEDRHRSSNRHYRSSGRHSSRSEHRHGSSRRYGADSDRSSHKQSREEDKSKEDKPKESKPKEVITISDDKSNDAETAPSKPEVPAKTPEQLKKEREEKIEKEHKLREERRKKERELERQMREERRKDQEIREKERRERARKEAERVRLEREKQRELEKQREKERERKRERFLRERKEREELDRVRREKEREALERERLELERLERERKERERLETERLQLERERQERERKAKQEREDRIERERLHLEEERLERERRERERESRTIDRGMEHRGGSSNLKRANELQQYDPKRLRREGELSSKSHFNGDQRNFVKDDVYDDVYQRRGNAAREDERFRKADPRVDRSCPAAPERRDPRLYGRDRSPLKVDRGYARDDRREWANEKNTNAPKTLSDVLGRAGLTGILGSQNDGRNDDRYRSDNRRDEPPRGVPDRNVRREEDMRRDGGMRREGDMRREGGDMRRDSSMRREPDVRRDVDMRRDDRGIDRFADQRRDDRKRPEVNSAPPVNIPDRRGLHPLAAEIGIRGLPHHPPPQPQQRMMQPITDMFGRPLRPVANATPAAQAIQAGYVAAAQGLALHQAARNNNMPFPNQVRHQSQSILPNIRRF